MKQMIAETDYKIFPGRTEKQVCGHCLPIILALVVMALTRVGAEPSSDGNWQPAFDENFQAKEWTNRWTLAGSKGPTDCGALRNKGKELTAWIEQEFKGEAIRVEFEAQMESTNEAISDLTCFIGGHRKTGVPQCVFQFGGENNTINRITFPKMPEAAVPEPKIKAGQWYKIRAELNGRVVSLAVDGNRIVTALLPAVPEEKSVGLYTWTGQAAFRNVKVYTKAQADAVPADLQVTKPIPVAADPPQALKPWRAWACPPITEVKPSALKQERIALNVKNNSDYQGRRPITMGVPIPKETLWDINAVRVVRENGKELPAEARVAATWTKGGAIRWVHLDFQPELEPNTAGNYFLELGRNVKREAVKQPVIVAEDARGITVDSGVLKMIVSKERGSLIEAAWLDQNGNGTYELEEQVVAPTGEKGSYFITDEGMKYSTSSPDSDYSAVVESAGPMRVVIRTRGWYKNEKGERACSYVNRIYVYRGLPEVRLFTTWVITVDTDRFRFQDVATRIPIVLKKEPRAMLGTDAAFTNARPWESVRIQEPAIAVQASRHDGFIQSGGKQTRVRDIGGWADVSDEKRGLTVGVLDMEQQWPNAIEVRPEGIIFHVFSNLGGHNLDFSLKFLKSYWGQERYEEFERTRGGNPPFEQRHINACGMAKTHEMVIRFHGKETEEAIGRFARSAQHRPTAWVDPGWACASGDIGIVHPYDPKRFPEFEKSLQNRFTEYLDILDRLTPVYGFYDYGMGIPHYVREREKSPKGEKEYIYNGYRREYDIGYANPIVPWELFLRSGEDRYYRYAVAFSRHCMDAHSQHWTNKRLNKEIGWITDEGGSWPYDSFGRGFTFNNWMEYLLLNYYITGHEHAMDVAVQFIDALYDECVTRGQKFSYCGLAGIWHGNAALVYRALWEDRLWELYQLTESQQLKARMRESGAFSVYPGGFKSTADAHRYDTHRQQWREYGLYHGTLVPDCDAELSEAFAQLGVWDLHAHGWGPRAPYYGSAYGHWAAYQRTKDPRFIKYAQLQLAREAPFLGGWAGLCELRQYFAWMTLAVLPGAENVRIPVTMECRRIETSPLFILHEKGRETRLTADRLLRVFDPQDKDATDRVMVHDKAFNEINLNIPADQPTGVYRVNAAEPSTNLWKPFTPLSFTCLPDLRFMFGMAEGIEADRMWLYIPAGTKEAQVCVSGPQKITLAMPDNTILTGTGPVWNVSFAPADKVRLVSLDQEPKERYAFFKVFGVPAYATLTKEAAFEMRGDLRTVADPLPSDPATVFVAGAFTNSAANQALQFNGKRSLEIPLGERKAEGRRAYFDANQGTIEFFIKLNTNPDLSGAQGLPIRLDLDKSVSNILGWQHSFLAWDYKTAICISDGERHEIVAMLGPTWSSLSTPVTLRAGRWYHLAVIWKLNENGKLLRESHLNGNPYLWPDAANAFRPVLTESNLWIGASGGKMRVRNYDFVLDELRISDIIRYPGNKAFQPPVAAFAPDEHTLLLYHFDGDPVGVSGADAKQVTAKFLDKP